MRACPLLTSVAVLSACASASQPLSPICPASSAAPAAPTAPVAHDTSRPLVVGELVELPWVRFGVVSTSVCKDTTSLGQDGLSIEILADNLGNAAGPLVDRITVEDATGHELPHAFGAGPACAPQLDAHRWSSHRNPGERLRGRLEPYVLPSSLKGVRLHARMSEPSGFDQADVVVDLDPARAREGELPASPAPATTIDARRQWVSPYYRVTLTRVIRCPDGVEENGKVAIGVEILVENLGKKPIEVRTQGELKDDQGYIHGQFIGANNFGCTPRIPIATYARPNDKVRGFMEMFVVPVTAKGMKLRYTIGSSIGATPAELLLDVGDVPPAK